jgi:hypothetical protein
MKRVGDSGTCLLARHIAESDSQSCALASLGGPESTDCAAKVLRSWFGKRRISLGVAYSQTALHDDHNGRGTHALVEKHA